MQVNRISATKLRARSRRALLSAAARGAGGIALTSICTAQSYPTKPIRIVNTVTAGGPAELIARMVGQKFTEAWGQQVVVDSRPGAAGIIGAEIAAHAAPDGYTLLLGSSMTMVLAPLLRRTIPYDPIKDFAHVSIVKAVGIKADE